jgi:hypothetical protein
LTWLDLQQSISLGQYYCLLAIALEKDEIEFYHWWINSQLDPKKFPWAEKQGNVFEGLFNLASKLSKGGKIVKGNYKEYQHATGRPVVYMDNKRNFFDEKMNPLPGFDFRKERNTIVVRIKDA